MLKIIRKRGTEVEKRSHPPACRLDYTDPLSYSCGMSAWLMDRKKGGLGKKAAWLIGLSSGGSDCCMLIISFDGQPKTGKVIFSTLPVWAEP